MSLLLLLQAASNTGDYSLPISVPPWEIEIGIGQEPPAGAFGIPPLRNAYVRAIDSFDITYTLHQRAILHCQVIDPTSDLISAYRPDTNQRVVVTTLAGVIIFNGRVAGMRENSIEQGSGRGVKVDVDAINDWEAFDHTFIERTFGSEQKELMWVSSGTGTLFRTIFPHGLTTGQIVTVSDVPSAPAGVNGDHTIRVVDEYHFANDSLNGTGLRAGGKVRGRFHLREAVAYAIGLMVQHGIELDPEMEQGPLLETMAFDNTVASALAELQKASGWVFRLLPTNRFEMFAPGTKDAPFSLTGDNVIGTPVIQKSRSNYANIIEVNYGQSLASGKTDSFFGNGSNRIFPLTYKPATAGSAESPGNIIFTLEDNREERIGVWGTDINTQWVYKEDEGPNGSVVQLTAYDPNNTGTAGTPTTPLGNNVHIVAHYSVAFPKKTRVSATQEQIDDAGGPWVKRVDAPDIFDLVSAQSYGQGALQEAMAQPRRATADTRAGLVYPGTTVPLGISGRLLTGTEWLVASVRMHEEGDGAFRYQYQLLEDNATQPGWIEYLKGLRGASGGSAGSSSTAPAHTGGGGGSGAGGLAGSGTVGFVPLWTGSRSLGDSIVRQLVGSVEVLGGLTAAGVVTATSYVGREIRGALSGGNDFRLLNAAGTTVFQVPAGTSQVQFSGAIRVNATITTPPATSLFLTPTGDLEVFPGSNMMRPGAPYSVNLGSLQRKFLSLHAAELWVETLVAHETIATIGGRILVGPTTHLIQDLPPGAGVMVVKHNQMKNGDRVYMEGQGKVEFIAITSGPSGSAGAWSYNIVRSLDTVGGANDWYAGDAIFNTGQVGSGFIDIYSIASVNAAAGTGSGPTIVGNVRDNLSYNGWSPRWAIGNLKGIYNAGVDIYGAAFGTYATGVLFITAEQGIIMMRNSTQYVRIDTTGAYFTGVVTVTGGNAALSDMSNVTTIDGGKITTHSIIAEKLNVTALSAITANVGNLFINAGGYIATAGMGWGGGGPGVFLGHNGAGYAFAVGNWAGNRLYFDHLGNLVVVSNYIAFGNIVLDGNGITIPNGGPGSGSRIYIGGAIIYATTSGRVEIQGNFSNSGYIYAGTSLNATTDIAAGGNLNVTGTGYFGGDVNFWGWTNVRGNLTLHNTGISWSGGPDTTSADYPLVRSDNTNIYRKTNGYNGTISLTGGGFITVERGIVTGGG